MSNNTNDHRKKKESIPIKYLLLFLTLFCSGAIYFSLTLNISGGPLHSAAGYVFVPMQKGINYIGTFISECVSDVTSVRTMEEENKELKQQVEELTNELEALKLDTYEIEDYKELLNLQSKYSTYEMTAASVIAKDSSKWFSTFTIDKGTSDGIEAGMDVLSGTGLVGIVTGVGGNYATVRSIIDDEAKVSGMVLTTKDNLIVSGSLESMTEDRVILFSNLDDEDNAVSVGDPVVTSYISDQYQQGILIGYIASITMDPNNITKSGTITPVVDFNHLSNVLVILDEKKTGTEDATEEEE